MAIEIFPDLILKAHFLVKTILFVKNTTDGHRNDHQTKLRFYVSQTRIHSENE